VSAVTVSALVPHWKTGRCSVEPCDASIAD